MRARTRTGRIFTALALMAALVLAGLSSGCGAGSGDAGAAGSEKGTVRIGWIPWDEDVAATHLWKRILEDEGYEVELTQLDVAPVFSGLSQGDLDLFLDAWLPVTHSDYWEEYGAQLEDLATWYDNGLLALAVPEYVDATTIEDLKGIGDTLGGRIVGIEPGAGLTRVTREDAMPGYGIADEYELVEGSTPAMLAELERATKAEEPIVITLWHPHWAYNAYPIKDLEDPKGLMGDAEEIHAVARSGFGGDFSEVAGWLAEFKMNDEQLASLEDLVINKYGSGQEEEAVEEWLSDPANRALVDGWLGK